MIINNPISLLCEALPYPSPNITWLKDEVPLKASRNVLLLPGTVLLCMPVVAPCCVCLGEGSRAFSWSGWVVSERDGEKSSSCGT